MTGRAVDSSIMLLYYLSNLSFE